MGREHPEPPEPIRSAIAELWRTSSRTEEVAFNTGAFRLLEGHCGSIYSGIKSSRQLPASESTPKELRSALENFFRWNGAPWYEGLSPSAEEAALKLHRAFLVTDVNRIYLAPLDRLALEDPTEHPHHTVRNVRFGPNEIALLSGAELGQRVRHEALKRFGRWYEFPIDKLDDFYWLIASAREKAGPIWERTWLAILHKTWDEIPEIGQVPVFEPTYPAPIEDALFVLLLSLVKEPREAPWKPFAVPWTYSLTDDPFANAPRAPDPSALTWTLVGPRDEEFEVPDHSESFKISHQQLQALEQQWRKLQAALARADTDQANFHPLTKHFFVKALAEEGIDEIVANISCIEATFMLNEPKGREKMKKRYKRLLGDGKEFEWVERGYKLRDGYLHSLGDPKEMTSSNDLGQTRWSVTRAVDRYLDLTEQKGQLNREELLRSL